ncbi:MAG: hypothetical protein GY861_29135, partial [bacterium]|nr:hypothetical protein [bacterium]
TLYDAIIQGTNVSVSSDKFGTYSKALNLNADNTYIKRLTGNIIIDSTGIGSSISIRGPPEGWGAIAYNPTTNLTLDAENVIVSGSEPTYFYGDITFSNFTCATPGKTIYFEAGKTYTILDEFTLTGGYGQLINLRSTKDGQQWKIDPRGKRDLLFMSVKDSYNVDPVEIVAIKSNKEENCFNWDPTTTWIGDGADNDWSTGNNWDTGVAPPVGNDVLFDGVSANGDKDATIDDGFNGSNTILSLTITGYTGIITQSASLTITNDYAQTSGTFTCTAPQTYSLSVGGDFSIPDTAGAFRRASGTDPNYTIYDVYGLQSMKCWLAKNFTLGTDIDASSTSSWDSGAGFESVGSTGSNFTGDFDGDNKTIAGLSINRSGSSYVGLFGVIDGSDIQDTGIVGGSVVGDYYVGGLIGNIDDDIAVSNITNCYSTASVTGIRYLGGLIGRSTGSVVTNCYATGAVTGTESYSDWLGGLVGEIQSGDTITNSYATGDVSGNDYIGGLVGRNMTGTITSSYAIGTVEGDIYVGGLVGYNRGTITLSYRTTGTTTGEREVGGLVGSNMDSFAVISFSYATGDVTATIEKAGGLIGYVQVSTQEISDCYATGNVVTGVLGGGLIGSGVSGLIRDCYSTGSVTGPVTGGLIGSDGSLLIYTSYWDTETSGKSSSDGGTGKTTAQMKQAATFSGWDWDDAWIIDEGRTYPELQFQYHIWNGDGSTNNMSEAANWSKDTAPGATDRIVFNDTSVKNATIDGSFASTIAQFELRSGYTGTVTQSNNLIISGNYYQSGTAFTGGTTLDVNDNFTVAGGTFTAPTNLYVNGDFNHSGGTFTHNSKTVTLDGAAQSISGSTTFYNLTKTVAAADTLTFTNGTTQTITNVLTLQGVSGELLSLRSDSAGDTWGIDTTGATVTADYLDVKDSNATALISAASISDSKDSGNNTNWFLAEYFKITGDASMSAGGTNGVTVTAYDGTDSVSLSYTGDKSITFSGANNAPDGTQPSASNSSSSDVNFGTTTTLTFTNGVASSNVKLYKTESISLDVADDTINTTGDASYDLDVAIAAANLDSFSWATISAATAGSGFTVVVTALDAYENATTKDADGSALTSSESVTFTTTATAAPDATVP